MPILKSEFPPDHAGGVMGLDHQAEKPTTTSAQQRENAVADRQLRDRCRLLQEALKQTGSADVRRVAVSVDHCRVILSGRVSSYYKKQVAQETVRPLTPGLEIENQIVVISQKPR